jgi:hypothetical protein
VALVEDQVSVSVAAIATEVEVATSDTVGSGGGGVTVMLTEPLPEPPPPVQARENVALCVRPLTVCVPEKALVPDHPPVPVQLVAFVEDHVSVRVPPAVIVI